MAYSKTILCLANSRKPAGTCVAGREIENGNEIGAWIRPVSSRPGEAISIKERTYSDNSELRELDLVRIKMLKALPKGFQSENHLIDPNFIWSFARRATWAEAESAIDKARGKLWINGYSSGNGQNDRVPLAQANSLTHSLHLVRPKALVLQVVTEGGGLYPVKRRVRASFEFDGNIYRLAVTDRAIEASYKQKANGNYPVDSALLCVSLATFGTEYAYKLVAAVIIPNLVG